MEGACACSMWRRRQSGDGAPGGEQCPCLDPCSAMSVYYIALHNTGSATGTHRGGQPPHVGHRHDAAVLAAAGCRREECVAPRLQINHRVISQAAKGLSPRGACTWTDVAEGWVKGSRRARAGRGVSTRWQCTCTIRPPAPRPMPHAAQLQAPLPRTSAAASAVPWWGRLHAAAHGLQHLHQALSELAQVPVAAAAALAAAAAAAAGAAGSANAAGADGAWQGSELLHARALARQHCGWRV